MTENSFLPREIHKNTLLPIAQRVIVLVPEGIRDFTRYAHLIYGLVESEKLPVLLISMAENKTDVLRLDRQLIALRAIIATSQVSVSKQVVIASSWISTLKGIVQEGDVVLCHQEQRQKTGLFRSDQVVNLLTNTLSNPVLYFSGFHEPKQVDWYDWFFPLVYWCVNLGIFSFFAFFSINLDPQDSTIFHDILLLFVLFIEVIIIYYWNTKT